VFLKRKVRAEKFGIPVQKPDMTEVTMENPALRNDRVQRFGEILCKAETDRIHHLPLLLSLFDGCPGHFEDRNEVDFDEEGVEIRKDTVHLISALPPNILTP